MKIDVRMRNPAHMPAEKTTKNTCVLFVGSALWFSDHMLQAAETEFPDIRFARLADPDIATTEMHSPTDRVGLVVFEEAFAGDVIANIGAYRELSGQADLVVAYRDIRKLRHLFDRADWNEALATLGFLPMNIQMDVWLSALRLLLVGESFFPRELVEVLHRRIVADGIDAPPPCAVANLTRREHEVLPLVARGLSNKLIAEELGVSGHTVKLHIHHLISKLGVSNRTGVANWYMSRNGRARSGRYDG